MSRHGTLRASDQDRDRIVERLHRAATEGRIASEELEQRVAAALKARTYGELEETVRDLPGRPSRDGRAPARRTAGGWTLAVVRENPILLLFAIPVVAVTAAMVVAATVVWAVLMIVVMVLGGHHGRPRPPWAYGRRRGLGPPRRGPGGYWA